ncbi:MAG: aldo/keto reductase [Chloroflexi bacterium]|nr:MAG: aldo/keto reductase [Chloroflexota bacterium]
MERRPLGTSEVDVPVIGMGTWRTFDTTADRAPLVNAALAAGVTLFDSSPMYGRAELTLAKALGSRRAEAQVATKIWTSDSAEGRRQAASALNLFGHVEIYQVHNLVAWPEQLALLEELKKESRVTVIGATHYQESAFGELASVMRTGRLDMVQIPYNPLRRDAEQELLPLAAELGLGVLVMSPLQGGILDRKPEPAQLRELSVTSWPEAVLKWIASDPRISGVLTATQDLEHLRQNVLAGEPPWFDASQRDLVAKIAGT